MKKKTLLLLATVFYAIASIVTPLLGFAYLEPSGANLMFICLLFCLSVCMSFTFCNLWIEKRRTESKQFEEDSVRV